MQSMNEAIVHSGPRVQIIEVPVPTPSPGQLLIKICFTASNQKDWKRPTLMGQPAMNQGDDVAGTVVSWGQGVHGFKVDDHVAALHCPGAPHGSYAEYCVVDSWAAWHIPANITMAHAVTIPLGAMTAGLALWKELGIPWPWSSKKREPIVVYGASSVVGAFGVQLAKLSGLGPVIAIAGQGGKHVESLLDLSGGDVLVDYRNGVEATVAAIKIALTGHDAQLALDAISTSESERVLGQVIDSQSGVGRIATVLPLKDEDNIEGIQRNFTISTQVFSDRIEKEIPTNANRWLGSNIVNIVAKAVADGLLKPHPFEIIPGGLEGIETGLKRLKDGKTSAVKLIYQMHASD